MYLARNFRIIKAPLTRFIHVTHSLYAGHSKWANIKHKKAANDAAKAAISFKMSSKITMLAKIGGSDLSQNVQLSNALDQAKSLNIPKKVLENAVKRGTGELKTSEKMETVVYEGIAPGGVAVMIEAITDNKNRTLGYLRPCFNKFNTSMTPTGYMFEKKGMLLIDIGDTDFDTVFETLVELGCEDVSEVEDDETNLVEVITDPADIGRVGNHLKQLYKIKEMQIGYIPIPDMATKITDSDTRANYEKFLRSVDDIDDVSQIYTNLIE
ncbi:hypothetical protein OGAPHI_006411 [Ogataea philodendri]|uniref:Transcriptional regulatory protein n=1 Tax=Ogataea philodendri TaxID=1378263 RepID=A0A9P8T0A3_9ASCO|nr:uncharacterized protein OGAPHI_006411 [Ogataea philodendri]KAH3661563.1 hypothetical protein OGAPHI_006411 [Ogataea philodendri]